MEGKRPRSTAKNSSRPRAARSRPGRAAGDALGVGQRVKDGQFHVRDPELGQYRGIDEFHQGMDHALGMDDHVDLFGGEGEEVAGLDDLQGLVHQGGGIDGDLPAHGPGGVGHGLLHRDAGEVPFPVLEKRPARSGQDDPAHVAPSARGQALEDGALLAVDGDDLGPAGSAFPVDELAGGDQGLLVGQAQPALEADGLEGGGQAVGAADGRDHAIGFGQGDDLVEPLGRRRTFSGAGNAPASAVRPCGT